VRAFCSEECPSPPARNADEGLPVLSLGVRFEDEVETWGTLARAAGLDHPVRCLRAGLCQLASERLVCCLRRLATRFSFRVLPCFLVAGRCGDLLVTVSSRCGRVLDGHVGDRRVVPSTSTCRGDGAAPTCFCGVKLWEVDGDAAGSSDAVSAGGLSDPDSDVVGGMSALDHRHDAGQEWHLWVVVVVYEHVMAGSQGVPLEQDHVSRCRCWSSDAWGDESASERV
jgi:hypothetical protein